MTIKRPWGDTIPFELSAVVDFDGTPVADLGGWELWFTVKTSQDEADPGVLQKTKSAGHIAVLAGTATWEITDDESRTLMQPDTDYLYDVQGRSPAGRIATLDTGKIKLTYDITRSA